MCVEEGVFAAQGYFLARPSETPAEASPGFRAWLDSRGGRVLPFEAPGTAARKGPADPEPESREPEPRSAEAERDFDL